MTRLAPGTPIRVREDFPPGHIRTPVYLRGKTGEVIKFFGNFDNAETAAYGLPGLKKGVYKVRFRAIDLWSDYAGPAIDAIEADLYEHWLERLT